MKASAKTKRISSINSIFFRLLKRVLPLFDGKFEVRLELDTIDRYPEPRNFAMSSDSVIYLSPKILAADEARIEGLLMHELAHVYMMKLGFHEHTELQTDQLAELIFEKRIYYDDNDIQTTKRGKHPRPSYLPNW